MKIADLNGLINLMILSPVYSKEILAKLWKKDKARQMAIIKRMLKTGETYGVASGSPSFLNQPENEFRAYLKKTDNGLDEQVKVVANAFTHYLATGETPAPYYPMRIAIILSKAKMKEKEREFLAAWCRHFSAIGRQSGVTYDDLVKRAEKIGVVDST